MSEIIINPDSRGRRESISVHLKEEKKTVRGDDPVNPRFTAIRDYVIGLLDKDDYEAWVKEIEVDLWEENVLNSDSKTDYNTEEPFLVLTMEKTWDKTSSRIYYHNVSIDMDGNVVLYANENKYSMLDGASPTIEVHATDKELADITKLIEENYWEIEEYNYSPDGGRQMDLITLNLTEDRLNVQGNDPEDHGFMAIRNAMLQFIDDETYETWDKKARKYIVESNPDF